MEFAGTIREAARETPVLARTDVLVVGGGSAGVAAAVAAARAGARVILAERYGALGGLATGGLIVLLLTLDDGAGRQVIAGLCQETTERMARLGGAYHPPPEHWGSNDAALVEHYARWGLIWGGSGDGRRVRYSVAYDPEIMREVMNQMVGESGAQLLFHLWGADALVAGDRLLGVAFQSKAGRVAILADVVIDATGDGDIYASAGCAFELERIHPWLWFRMGGVDVDAAQAAGAAVFRTTNPGQVLLPWGSMARMKQRIDATDPRELSLAEIECRKLVMEEARELRSRVPGMQNAYVSDVASQLGITESRRLTGRYVLARDDSGRTFDDAIAITGHWTRYGVVYAIPYRCLLTKHLRNLLVVGRTISADHRTHNATKEIPPCMATGQAAGLAAALSLESSADASALDVRRLQDRLRAAGALLDYPFETSGRS